MGCFQLLEAADKAAGNIHVRVLLGTAFCSSGKYLEAEQLGGRIGMCVTFEDTATLFSKVVVPFYIPTVAAQSRQRLVS